LVYPVSKTNKKFAMVNGRKMAYVETGEGDPIVFQHGNPTSSYLWRNVMPHLAGRGRLIACDLVGMGDSEKIDPSGPDRYTYLEHRNYLFDLWDQLSLERNVVLVLHDWGSVLGFDWAAQHPERVAGIVYTEAVVMPFSWSDWPDKARGVFQGFRSPAGEQMILVTRLSEFAVKSQGSEAKRVRARDSFDGMKCNVAHALQAIGDEWSVLILRDVSRGIHRYDELLAGLRISPTVLSRRLATLTESGILERVQYSTRPPRFEYQLTPAGRELEVIIHALDHWGYDHARTPEAVPPVAAGNQARQIAAKWFRTELTPAGS
jgi:pimeloyl-ACP methyl ester carboxylesterase